MMKMKMNTVCSLEDFFLIIKIHLGNIHNKQTKGNNKTINKNHLERSRTKTGDVKFLMTSEL